MLIITFYPLTLTGYLTLDDVMRDLHTMIGGLFSEIPEIGESTGRLTLIPHFFLTHIPYLSEDFIYRKALLITPHILVVAFFSMTLYKYLNSRTAAFGFVILFLVFFT